MIILSIKRLRNKRVKQFYMKTEKETEVCYHGKYIHTNIGRPQCKIPQVIINSNACL